MKISEHWLREWVNPALDAAAIADQLTMAGLEVDAVAPVAGVFSGVVVAEIISAEPHPDADKLRVCQVSTGGDETVQIVCGAPNARAGLKAPLAVVGALLPGEFKIKKAKLRGADSQGMLCAEAELGLSDESDGLMELAPDAPVGKDLRDYLSLDDSVIEVDLTPNRTDCLSMRGIAREVGVLNGLAVCEPAVDAVDPGCDATFPVRLSAPERCPRYVGRVIRGVDLSCPSPLWLQEKLRRGGIRSIDAVVDVTNYLLLELGQPMHAFDLANLSGAIDVRMAAPGETLALLNGSTIELREDSLVIADDSGPLALAGIMGGDNSGVGVETRDIFLESAFFAPEHLAGQARSYGLHTDSSHRFERGVDFTIQRAALERATRLLLDIVGGDPGPVIEVVEETHLPERKPVVLRRARIERVLGVAMEDTDVERILNALGLTVESIDGGWSCAVPPWRFDIAIEADLLEELARVYGYHRLPVTRIRADLIIPKQPETEMSPRLLRRHLVSRGYREAITYSFIDAELQARFDPDLAPVVLRNPISTDMAVMRTSLIPGLVLTARRNINRQQSRLRLFETGLRFRRSADGQLHQDPTLAMLLGGRARPERWSEWRSPVDFYDLKGDLESLFGLARTAGGPDFAATERAGLHPGQTASISVEGQEVGYIGALHPESLAQLDVDQSLFVAEIDLAAVLQVQLPASSPVSRFPEVRRDLALVVDRSVTAAEIVANVRATAGPYFKDLTLFDVYEGKGIDPKRKSLALGLTFGDQSRTLGDDEVIESLQQVVDSLKKKYNAELRG